MNLLAKSATTLQGRGALQLFWTRRAGSIPMHFRQFAVINKLERLLRDGLRRSRQGSFQRRAPARDAVPYLTQARLGLRMLVRREPSAHAEEAFLNYSSALGAAEKAIALSGKRDKKTLKRLAQLKSAADDWASLRLPPEQLNALGEYLEEKLGGTEGDGTFRWTREWTTGNCCKTW